MLAALASSPATKALDPDPFPRHSLRHAVYAALLHFGFETAEYIKNPKAKIPGTKMVFPGIKTEKEADDLWSFLQQFGPDGKKKS